MIDVIGHEVAEGGELVARDGVKRDLVEIVIRAGRAGDVMDLAHTLKGSLRLLGAPATALLAEQLEIGGRSSQLEGLGPVVEQFDREMARLFQWVETRLTTPAPGKTIAPETA